MKSQGKTNSGSVCRFFRWSRKSSSAFNSLKRVVVIARLSVYMADASLRKTKRRFGKMKRRVILLKRRDILPKRRDDFLLLLLAELRSCFCGIFMPSCQAERVEAAVEKQSENIITLIGYCRRRIGRPFATFLFNISQT